MNYSQANEMRAKFLAMEKFTRVDAVHDGFYSKMTPEIENDGTWTVDLRCVSARAGNRNLTVVREYSADDRFIALIAKKALGAATARDTAALDRMRAEKSAE